MSEKETSPEEIIRGATTIGIVTAAVALGPSFAFAVWVWKNPQAIRRFGIRRVVAVGVALVMSALCVWYLWFDVYPLYKPEILYRFAFLHVRWVLIGRMMVFGWWGGLGAVMAASPVVLIFKKPGIALRRSDFRNRVRNFAPILKAFKDPKRVPIGIDPRTGAVCSFEERKRYSHMIVLGATGGGKTTLEIIMALHAIRHGQPCIIIDPKGEDSTIELIQRIGRMLDKNFDARFKAFRMSKPAQSCHYNPLKHGNSIQLKDRILEALNWSEQYYQSVAGDFLTVLTACTEHLGMTLTFDLISSLISKLKQNDLLVRLVEKANQGDAKAKDLHFRLSTLMAGVKANDLAGLQAQLSILNNPYIGHLLSFSKSEIEIDLRDVLAKNQIAYFQLDTLGNPDTARRLGRVIIEDIKGLASEVYRTIPEEERKFLPIFIDEFGSFASKEFIEVLKQIRGARFGVHLFSQGLEDLDVVSRNFRRQASSNPITKIAFRLDDSETVDEVCSMAGTLESTEQSFQVEGTIAPIKTGLGNLRESRQMVVEHDVLKNLNTGQAVVIEKSPSRVLSVDVFHPNILYSANAL